MAPEASVFTAARLAYKSRHGAKELLEHWQESGVAFWNPGRPPEPALA